jgi:hypothetical protein
MVFSLSFVVCIQTSTTVRPLRVDEMKFVIPTIEYTVEHGRPPVFSVPSRYMAPFQVALAAAISGNQPQLTTYRVLGSIFLSFTCRFAFLYFRSQFAVGWALVCTFWLAATLVKSPVLSWPGYPLGICRLFVYLIYTLHGPSKDVPAGLSSGLLYYLFPVSAPILCAHFALVQLQLGQLLTDVKLLHPTRLIRNRASVGCNAQLG